MSDVVSDVKWLRTLRVVIVRRTPEVSGPRGWGEGACHWVDITKDDDDHLLFKIGVEEYRFSSEVIEAIYDLHQDVPR